MNSENTRGHLAALLTVSIWGTTFVSTKILLADFQPVEILFLRFLIGFLVLLAAYPKRFNTKDRTQEIIFALAGMCGVCLYYLLENIALTLTSASDVGVIISSAPFFTAIMAKVLIKSQEKMHSSFFLGMFISMFGICLISFNASRLQLNPLGDFLALSAALIWACYSILTRKIGTFGYSVILSTRKIFCYGLLFMTPALFLFDFHPNLSKLANITCLMNILYLGLGASALCFITWNFSIKSLGAIKTSVYIYMVPVITVVASVFILGERLNLLSGIGTLLTLTGLFLSERQQKK